MSSPVARENLRKIWNVRQDRTEPPRKSLKILSSHDNFLALYLFPHWHWFSSVIFLYIRNQSLLNIGPTEYIKVSAASFFNISALSFRRRDTAQNWQLTKVKKN